MPIVDITGFTTDEVSKMKAIRLAIQQAFQVRWGFEELVTTTVNFLVDPSVEPSLALHAMARIYTKQFIKMDNAGRDVICDDVVLLMETYGEHSFNEAFSPGYNSMRGGFAPYELPFSNPTGKWEHDGAFVVHLTEDAVCDKIADYKGIEFDRTIVTVGKDEAFPGRVTQGMGGIQMYAGIDQPLYWGYKYLIRITKLDGTLIWENKQL